VKSSKAKGAELVENRGAARPFLKKQSQLIVVQCSAFSGQRQDKKELFEKTKPICAGSNWRNVFTERRL
jgi:hypothetical protein